MDKFRICIFCNREFYPKEKITFKFGVWADETSQECEDCVANKEFPEEEFYTDGNDDLE